MLNISCTISLADILAHLQKKTVRMCYICYTVAYIMGDTLDNIAACQEFIQSNNAEEIPSRHYAFLESKGLDHDLSTQIVGQLNQLIHDVRINGVSHWMEPTWFRDELLEKFQSRSLEEVAMAHPAIYPYNIWGRETRINMLTQILEKKPDAVFEINL